MAAAGDEQAHEVAPAVEEVHLEQAAVDGDAVATVLAPHLHPQGAAVDGGVEEHVVATSGPAGPPAPPPATRASCPRRSARGDQAGGLTLAVGTDGGGGHRHVHRALARAVFRGEDPLHEGGVEVAGKEGGMVEHPLEEGQGRLDPQHLVLGHRAPHAPDRVLPAVAPDHELAQQRVVVNGDLVPLVDAAVVPHPRPSGEPQGGDAPGTGQEALVGVLGVDPALDGVATLVEVVLAEGQPLPAGDADLELHQVLARDHLRDGVLDLEARVHLQEVGVARRRPPGTRACPRSRSPRASRGPPRAHPCGRAARG